MSVFTHHTLHGRHPRNRQRGWTYDFPALQAADPELAAFIQPDVRGGDTIDFFAPAAVTALNRAILRHDYGLADWDLPPGALCPPIPGRADYIHFLADLLGGHDPQRIPRGASTVLLDVGTGANCIYPLLGHGEYGWRFVGTDIEPASLAWAKTIVARNPGLDRQIELRWQPSASAIFAGVTAPDETFAACLCNPPFHASAEAAAEATARKWRQLGLEWHSERLNFGGQQHELWCKGGELGFIRRMIAESAERPTLCDWFTTYVSRAANLPAIHQALAATKAAEVLTCEMINGAKKSRIVAWRF